ncbi:hypothetical protein [Streptomyces klenkii]|nr:hypothetical protein [Streptomyces klenkii]
MSTTEGTPPPTDEKDLTLAELLEQGDALRRKLARLVSDDDVTMEQEQA